MSAVEGLALLLLLGGVAPSLGSRGPGNSSHSMRFYKVSVSEPGPRLPWFIIVGYVDDQRFLQYDSDTRKMVPQVPWMKKVEEDFPDYLYWEAYFAPKIERFFRDHLWARHNHSKGFHTWQWTHGCELGPDGRKEGYNQFGYDGKDFLSLDKETLTWTAADASAVVTKLRWEAELDIAWHEKRYLEEECIERLQKFLDYGKETLLRTEQPTWRMARKKGYDGRETLFCQLYGFYPKEINITWRKDGEVWDEDTFHGGVVPNSDGTYHTWRGIEIDPKEKARYRCQVEHGSLLEPLDLAWEEPASKARIILGIFGGILAVAIILGAIIFFMARFLSAEKREKKNYGAMELISVTEA